ncbi:MAG: extracellular solute-binding protein, partial [Clostridiales bacterium]|nr:extracellular solute-binding protein [Clostridiales bacterium]
CGLAASALTEAVEMETITVWSDNAHEKELRVKQVDTFNNTIGKELGINIEYTVFGDSYSDSIKIAAQAGETPDMFRADTKFMQDFVSAGYVVPLSDIEGGDELIDKYDGLLAKQYHIFDDKVYTLPYNLTTYKFVINVDLFEAAGLEIPYDGWTWNQVREYAQKITEVSNGKAYGFGLSLKALWTISSYLTMPCGTNIGHYGYNWNESKFDFTALEPMITAVYNIAQDGSVFPGFEGLDGDGIRAQFSEGRIGIMGAASFDAAVFNEQFPAKCEWAVVPEPSFEEDGSPYKEFVQPAQLLVLGERVLQHPEKAMVVYNYFYSDECAAEMYEQGLYVPIRQEAIDMATKQPEAKGFAEFANIEEKFVMAPMPDTLISVEGLAYREVLVNILSGQAGSDIKGLLEDCDQRYNDALQDLSQEQLELFMLPEGTIIERSK